MIYSVRWETENGSKNCEKNMNNPRIQSISDFIETLRAQNVAKIYISPEDFSLIDTSALNMDAGLLRASTTTNRTEKSLIFHGVILVAREEIPAGKYTVYAPAVEDIPGYQ